jgi:hypothetical protein
MDRRERLEFLDADPHCFEQLQTSQTMAAFFPGIGSFHHPRT